MLCETAIGSIPATLEGWIVQRNCFANGSIVFLDAVFVGVTVVGNTTYHKISSLVDDSSCLHLEAHCIVIPSSDFVSSLGILHHRIARDDCTGYTGAESVSSSTCSYVA